MVTPYLICYVLAGLLLTLSAAVQGVFAPRKRLVASVVTLLFWPLIVFVAPETFFRNSTPHSGKPDPFRASLRDVASNLEGLPLTDDERRRLERALEVGEHGVAYFNSPNSGREAIAAYWESDIPPAAFYELQSARRALEEREDSGLRFSLAAPDWYIGFSNEFVKSVKNADRKLQGRLLEAIAKIGKDPTTPVGDTIKPLTGNLAGLWRYRIGDNRLVYFPHVPSKRVTLISFGSRGDIYEDMPNTDALTRGRP